MSEQSRTPKEPAVRQLDFLQSPREILSVSEDSQLSPPAGVPTRKGRAMREHRGRFVRSPPRVFERRLSEEGSRKQICSPHQD